VTARQSSKTPILQIVADGAPGGGTTAVLGLCEDLLSQNKWDVHLITAEGSYAEIQARQKGVAVHPCKFPSSRFDLSLPWKLRKLIDNIQAKVIHVHGGRAAHQFSLHPLRKLDCKMAYTVHGYHFPVKSQPMRYFARLAEKKIATRVDHVCFVSQADLDIAVAERLLAPETRYSVIHNGVDPAEFTGAGSVPKTHDLIFVGRMVHQKNPQFVIDVLQKLRQDEVKLLMVGGGDLESEVRARAVALDVAHLVTFTGKIDRSAAISALQRAKLFIFPSRWEGLPIGPMEAMLCGVPVIGSNVAGTREVVSSELYGILINGFDANEYAAQIRGLLADESRLRMLAENGRQKVLTTFLRSVCSSKYASLYEKLLGHSAV
jgi:glycosyltransferase involved in cell wall biosynthesis